MTTQPVTILPAMSDSVSIAVQRDIAGFTFDAVISESHVSEMEVTENPVETGVSIADHVFMRPLKVTINAVVSDLKMPSASNLYDGSPSGRVRRAWEVLSYLQTDLANNTATPFGVTTGLRDYENMVCTSLSATQDVVTSSLLAFTAELTQVTILNTAVASYTEPVPMPKKPTNQAKPAIDKGNVDAKPITDPVKESSAADLAEAIGGKRAGEFLRKFQK